MTKAAKNTAATAVSTATVVKAAPKTPDFAMHYVQPGLYRSNPAALKNGRTYEMARTEAGQWALSRTLKTGKVEAQGEFKTNYDAIRAAREAEGLEVVLPAKTIARRALAEKLAGAKAQAEANNAPNPAPQADAPAAEAQVEL